MRDMLRRCNTIWARLTPGNRAGLVLVFGAMAIAVPVTVSRTSEAPYATLYTDLAPEDVGVVVNRLSALGVPCRVSDGGTVIRVPRQDVETARLNMTSQAHAQGGVAQDEGSIGSDQVGLWKGIAVYLESKARSMQDGALWVLALLLALIYLRKALVHLGHAIAATAVSQPPEVTTTVASQEGGTQPVEPPRLHPANAFRDRARARPDEAAEIIRTMMRESPCH